MREADAHRDKYEAVSVALEINTRASRKQKRHNCADQGPSKGLSERVTLGQASYSTWNILFQIVTHFPTSHPSTLVKHHLLPHFLKLGSNTIRLLGCCLTMPLPPLGLVPCVFLHRTSHSRRSQIVYILNTCYKRKDPQHQAPAPQDGSLCSSQAGL